MSFSRLTTCTLEFSLVKLIILYVEWPEIIRQKNTNNLNKSKI